MAVSAAAVLLLVKAKDDASRVLSGVDKNAKGLASSMGALKVAGLAAAGGLGAAYVASKQLIGPASDLQESLGKVRVVFGELSVGVESWADDSARAFGQSKQQALEAAGTYGNLFQAFGVGQKESKNMSLSLVELAADLASFNNTSVDEALIALRSGLSGEAEPLKRFGVAINDARLRDEALRLGLIKTKTDALDPGAKAQAAYALIMHDTTLAQGDFERTSGGLANKQRILSATITDVKAKLGTLLLPVMTAVVGVLTDAIPVAEDFINLLIAAGKGEAGRALELFARLPAPLQEVALWLAKNRDTIEEVIDVGKQLGRDVLTGWARILKELAPLLADLGAWLAENKPVALALAVALGVVVAVLIGIPAVIAAVIIAVGLLAAHWDEIKQKTLDVWNSLPGPIQVALETIADVVEFQLRVIASIIEYNAKIWRDIIAIVMALLTGDWGAAWDGVKSILSETLEFIQTNIVNTFNLINDLFGGFPGRILEHLGAWGSAALSLGNAIKDGLVNGITGGFIAAKDLADEIWDALKAVFNAAIRAVNETIPNSVGKGIFKFDIPDNPIPELARGARNFAGGLALVGERGPELVTLPRGANVYSAGDTQWMGAAGMSVGAMTVILPNVRDPQDFARELDRYFR